jgi:2-polyprenyl-3-methyl-5-hydroxy-6-metoxy-1,4-benzoquinol methylase
MTDLFIPDTSRLNPNLDAIHRRFEESLNRYFDARGCPTPEYFEEVACYNCGSRAVGREFVIARFRHVRCDACGMVYVSPRLREALGHDSYTEDYYTETYRLKLIPALPYRTTVINPRKYAQLMEYFFAPGSILDVGCGLGDFLHECKSRGWKTLGIELNPFAADYARREFGLDVAATSVSAFDEKVERFDCVTLWGVLEHVVRPVALLEKARDLLRPGGLLVLEVPSGDSFLVRYYERYGGHVDRIIEGDRHIMLFSVQALREMTARAGFREIRLQSNGLDFDTLNRLESLGLAPELTARWQGVLDNALSGDLLRGFFTPM